ncbi:MAG: hypothetical protein GY928_19960 [Colwellia sp.]|nr:hypothetical protein [Colwellia sp.]
MSSIKRYFVVIFIAIAMFGCTTEPKENAADVSIAFFNAIYNKNDINEAKGLCTANFANEINKYITTKNIARRLFNMSFDYVEINAALGDLKVRSDFEKSGELTLLFTGYRQEKTYKELKKIKLIKQGDSWLIDALLPDPTPY